MSNGKGRLRPIPDTRDWRLAAISPGMAAPLELTSTSRVSRSWRAGPLTDQGQTPMCVGYGWFDLLTCGPVRNPAKTDPKPQDIYALAQQLDEWPGTNYDGSSVRGGAKAVQQMGFVTNYAFAQTVREVANYILTTSPCVFGTVWTPKMETPFLYGGVDWIEPDSGPVDKYNEGHCYLVRGVDLTKHCPDSTIGAIEIRNSWGPWGHNGDVWISLNFADILLRAQGEACCPVEILKA
jgi:hypothetical protein